MAFVLVPVPVLALGVAFGLALWFYRLASLGLKLGLRLGFGVGKPRFDLSWLLGVIVTPTTSTTMDSRARSKDDSSRQLGRVWLPV